MGLKQTRIEGTYASVISDGSIRVQVDKETPGAKLREGDLKDGTHFAKYEMVYNEISGKIQNIEFVDSDYGKNIKITIDGGDELPIILFLSTASNFGEDFMKKLPNINLKEEVTIKPYSMEVKGKNRKGVSIIQDKEKVQPFFIKVNDDKSVEYLHEMPSPGDIKDKDDWKIYFMTVRKFLINYIENNIISTFSKEPEDTFFDGAEIVDEGEIKVDDIKM